MSYNLNTQCCGMHEVCEKESLRAAQEDIEYYEDEELDRFRGRTAYSEDPEFVESLSGEAHRRGAGLAAQPRTAPD